MGESTKEQKNKRKIIKDYNLIFRGDRMLKIIKSLYYKYFYKPKEWQGTLAEWNYKILQATSKLPPLSMNKRKKDIFNKITNKLNNAKKN